MKGKMKELIQEIQNAEMILVGVGEEFDHIKGLRLREGYHDCRMKLEHSEKEWLIPALNFMYEKNETDVYDVLSRLAEVLAEKNYFVVSVSTNERIREVSWREKRLVMPCGGASVKQCADNCGQELLELAEEDWSAIREYMKNVNNVNPDDANINLGICPKCGAPLVINSIYTSKYDENGYLEQWQFYTKWLQGTLNRKLLVLELGVGMQCPSVIRWPFEKVAFFNQKATFWRINEKLYQLSEELKGKGTSIAMNAIDWLRFL